ncbi:MAG: formate--tetrahydrofolate ligase [Candidatus Saganbacteria bacterium]|nr:formate--tetrahydrofolate ligase [Candidatus Saganbacteria bacterium]
MPTDIQIAQEAELKKIEKIARSAGILTSELEPHGIYKGKIKLAALRRLSGRKDGKLILVTTMTPTPQGEGKTTTTIGLAQALKKIGKKPFICIREPSLGPVMGMKGGAAGGGYSQVLPMADINLHFIGDIHCITSAHNLLSAMLCNHIHQGNDLNIDPKKIVWQRSMDMNDRALRGSFEITASSEVMAVMCLSTSIENMKSNLSKIIVAYTKDGKAVTCGDLKAQGAMTLLLKDALKPNLVQSIEGVPAFVHGGPFANIAHGCNSLMATRMALKLSKYVVTEAGFGADLGAEKFFDIKCRAGNLKPNAVVLVVTAQAFRRNGIDNLKKHVDTIKSFGLPLIVAINKKINDSSMDIEQVTVGCRKLDIDCVISKIWEHGGSGGSELAKKVVKLCREKNQFNYLYDVNDPIPVKIKKIATKVYGAADVKYTNEAKKCLDHLHDLKLDKLPICMAKTQYSLTDNPKAYGRPPHFNITVTSLRASAGAGFIVAYTGNVLTMPGLPKHPAAENMDISEDGVITGLF